MSLETAEAFVRATSGATHMLPGQWIQLAIADTNSDQLLGDVGLYLEADCSFAEIGFTLARVHHGKGHASRAVALAVEQALLVAAVTEVRAATDAVNNSSVAVLRRAGFVQTESRQAHFKGQACIELLFSGRRSEA
jgi:RimJ/RimL family protein N-acetyltransferase